MPKRMLASDLGASESLAGLSFEAEVTFMHLVSVADDFGRFDGRLRILFARLFPLRDDVSEAALGRWLAELEGAGLIHRYESDKGPAVHFTGWEKHQRVRATESKYGAPTTCCGPKSGKRKRPAVNPRTNASNTLASDGELTDGSGQLRLARRNSEVGVGVGVGVEVEDVEEEEHEGAGGPAPARPNPVRNLLRADLGDPPAEPDEIDAWLDALLPEIEASADAELPDEATKKQRGSLVAKIALARWRTYLRGEREYRGAAERARVRAKMAALEAEHAEGYQRALAESGGVM